MRSIVPSLAFFAKSRTLAKAGEKPAYPLGLKPSGLRRADLGHRADLDRWCELCEDETWAYAYGTFDHGRKQISLCASCCGAFEMGQASPDAAVYPIENVRFVTDEIGSHTVTANFDGFEWKWKEVSHVPDTVTA